ncbi:MULTISPECIES: glycosyltransferase [Arthrobacter]|uniref:glycosyltransferase n=1 Tax=unclassified Arthrobacter TaxID=235627 RepID=UPI0024BB401E|nr:glycosyltransferase [Arthrobacter sp. H35-MC1]MDJ0318814.1 glycosyltransferase [Arthrobacter sp. H35-MC1]
MRVQNCLDALKQASRLVDALRLADDLAVQAGRNGGVRNLRILRRAIGSTDQIVAIAAIHAVAQMDGEEVDVVLSDLLSSQQRFIREHAAWAHRSRVPRPGSVGRLIGLVVSGGFASMLAQRTLEVWATSSPDLVAIGLESALLGVKEPTSRYRLVETLGLVQQPVATTPLLEVAQDGSEEISVRVAAVAALGQRQREAETVELLERLVTCGGNIGEVAELSLVDLAAQEAPDSVEMVVAPETGLTVAQLFLHADIDATLSRAGSGDNGGIATLLVRLGDALVADQAPVNDEAEKTEKAEKSPTAEEVSVRSLPIGRVLTLSRGDVIDAAQSIVELERVKQGHIYARIPLLQPAPASAKAWTLLVAARRGISRMLRAAGDVHVIHLRMADVGSLAAFDVARALEIPVVFTVAPDPHAVIDSMDRAGTLTRENFGTIDEIEHFWFRARLVQRLATNSAHSVFFPRPNLRRDIINLVGIDVAKEPLRHTIVPEGVDLKVIDQAVREAEEHAGGKPATAALLELEDLLRGLPPARRGLPLVISVGRFHRIKGMATVVEAWAGSELRDKTNLLLIGGNLKNPSADEREQLGLIDAIVQPADRLKAGLLLPGHQPNNTVARWVAAARTGVPGYAAPLGVYVCGSLKEEFGIALLEAMASGLLVVAPDSGGPATYVEQGRTGFLTTTWDTTMLGDAIVLALEQSVNESTDDRAAYARSVVQEQFTIEAMAHTLNHVYTSVHSDDIEMRRELITYP